MDSTSISGRTAVAPRGEPIPLLPTVTKTYQPSHDRHPENADGYWTCDDVTVVTVAPGPFLAAATGRTLEPDRQGNAWVAAPARGPSAVLKRAGLRPSTDPGVCSLFARAISAPSTSDSR